MLFVCACKSGARAEEGLCVVCVDLLFPGAHASVVIGVKYEQFELLVLEGLQGLVSLRRAVWRSPQKVCSAAKITTWITPKINH